MHPEPSLPSFPAPFSSRRRARGGQSPLLAWISWGPILAAAALVTLALAGGCGTTRWTDTKRTATEQLLLTDAVDRSIDQIDFSPLADREVYFDAKFLNGVTDEFYVVSAVRQKLLATGCILKDSRSEAEVIVEARAGSVGTDRSDLTFGIPAVSVPTGLAVGAAAPVSAIPEIPFVKRTDQRAVVKISLYAFHRETGYAMWQSRTDPVTSTAKDIWVFGAGPFQRGTIYKGTAFAGEAITKSQDQDIFLNPNLELTNRRVFDYAEPLEELGEEEYAEQPAGYEE